MTSIAICGDWHANLGFAKQVVEKLAKEDVHTIFHVGDFGFLFEPYFVDNLNDYLEEHDMVLRFCRGNHDDPHGYGFYDNGIIRIEPHHIASRIIYMPDYSTLELEGTTFMFVGGAFSIDRAYRLTNVDWWREELTTIQSVPKADIIISHDAPLNFDMPLGKIPMHLELEANENRKLLQGAVRLSGADSVFCGHYHIRYMGYTTDGKTLVAVMGHDGMRVQDNYVILKAG